MARRPDLPRTAALVALLMLAPTVSCRRPGSSLTTKTLQHAGVERSYHVYLPPGHDKAKPSPLVLALHGGGGTGEGFDRMTGGRMTTEADRRGFIVVFPEGIEKGWDDGRVPVLERDRVRAALDDVGFLRELIDRLDVDYGVDRSRVYATGISNGGFMSFRLALDLSDRIAAIAPVTANLAKVHEHAKPQRPVSVMIVNGTLDPLVPYAGGQVKVLGMERGEVLSTADTVDWWVEQDGCTAPPAKRTLPDTDPGDGAHVEVEAHEGCSEGSAVVLYRVEGGGHTWPSGQQYLPRAMVGGVCRDLDATREIFDFFEKHRR